MDQKTPPDAPATSARWWDCRRPLTRERYLRIGVALMLLKYAVEWAAITQLTGHSYSPLAFINPLASARRALVAGGPDWLTPAWLLWTAPFVAIAVTLTVRRAIDAGRSPWWGMAMLVPFLNLVVMIVLACWPTAHQTRAPLRDPVAQWSLDDPPPLEFSGAKAMLAGAAISVMYAIGMTLVCIYAFDSYGAALFFGTPAVAGATAAFTFNFHQRRDWASSIGVAVLPIVCLGAVLLFLAFEGIICLVMAAPIMIPMAIVGGALGKGIADIQRGDATRRRDLVGCLVALPLLALGESRLPHDFEYCVTSSVDVAATPEQVWRHVVDFPPITAPEPWLFRIGVAGPIGARIEGRGVGAVRHCDFTTGSFVEPITVWDEPRRLAFDVTDQPEPMFELSPYRDVHPPHLEGSFRSTRGEFRLQPLAGGGTRLVGRTWYRLELAPHAYWTMWTDGIIHRIHRRVLEHIQELAEGHGDPQIGATAGLPQRR